MSSGDKPIVHEEHTFPKAKEDAEAAVHIQETQQTRSQSHRLAFASDQYGAIHLK